MKLVHFVAGTHFMIAGRAIPTVSEMLLQKMGMKLEGAAFTNNLVLMVKIEFFGSLCL